jgi:hypothetical protein
MKRNLYPRTLVTVLGLLVGLHGPAVHAHGVGGASRRAGPASAAPAAWDFLPHLDGTAAAGRHFPLENRIGRLKLLLNRLIAEAVHRTDGLTAPRAHCAKVELPLVPAQPLLARFGVYPRGP